MVSGFGSVVPFVDRFRFLWWAMRAMALLMMNRLMPFAAAIAMRRSRVCAGLRSMVAGRDMVVPRDVMVRVRGLALEIEMTPLGHPLPCLVAGMLRGSLLPGFL